MIYPDLDRIAELLAQHPYERLITDPVISTLAERYLERVVNRAIDINFHCIRAAGGAPPDDYTTSFLELASLKILPARLAHDIAPAAGARNVLIHEYDDLDSLKFYSSLKDAVRLFPKYLKAIDQWVEEQSNTKRS